MATLTSTMPSTTRSSSEPGSIRNTLRSEWTKTLSHRNSRTLLIVAAILSIGITALLMWGTGYSWSEWTETDKAMFDPLQTSLVGVFFAGILSLVIAANLVTNEYASGMIRLTMTITPNRTRVVLTKMIVIGAFLVLPLMLITFATIWIGQVVLGLYDMPTAHVFGEDFGVTFWLGLSGLYYPMLTVAAGFILRSAAATISAMVLTMFFPSMFGGLFPTMVQERVLSLLPGNAIDALVLGHLNPDNRMYLDRPWAALVAIAWLVGLTALAIRLVNRRDVG